MVAFHNTKDVSIPSPIGHYSQIVELPNGMVYLSGIKAWKVGAGDAVSGDIQEQTNTIFDIIEDILETQGMSKENIIRIQCHIANVDDYEEFNKVYAKRLLLHQPARTVLAGYTLRGGAAIELVVDAYRF